MNTLVGWGCWLAFSVVVFAGHWSSGFSQTIDQVEERTAVRELWDAVVDCDDVESPAARMAGG